MTLAQRNIRSLFWARLFGSVTFLEPVLVLFYLHRGISEQQIFFALLSFSLTMLVAEVPTGAFADRYGPKASFLVGGLLQLLSTVALLFAFQPALIFLSRSLAGLSATFFSGAEEALIYESLKESGEEEKMDEVAGKINSGAFIASLITVVFGAFIARDLTEAQFSILILMTAAGGLLQLVFLLFVRNPAAFAKFRDNPLVHVRQGMAILRATPDLLKLFANYSIVFIPTYIFTAFDQPMLTGAGMPVAGLGIVYAAAHLLSTILSRNVGWFTRRWSRPGIMLGTGLSILAGLALAASLRQWLPVGLLAFFLVRQARTIRWPVYSHLQNQYIPSGSRATTLSLLSVLDSFFDLLIVLPLATTTAGLGLTAILGGCALVVLLGLLLPAREARVPATDADAVNS